MEILGPNGAWIVGLAVFVGTAVSVWWKHFRSPDGEPKQQISNAVQEDIDALNRAVDKLTKDLRSAHLEIELQNLEIHAMQARIQRMEGKVRK